jgi:CelD/BcsL family acetyltransferase involved in cellulose biosynthesis
MRNVQVARLSQAHLPAVVALEREIYPPESQEAESLIEARLSFEDANYSSLNLGLFDDDRLVGYILAHLDDGADFRANGIADNVYIADIAVSPHYRRHLIRLLEAFTREVRREYPGLPVVAHSIGGSSDFWEKHAAVIDRLGGEIATRIDGVRTETGGVATLVVWRNLAADRERRGEARTMLPPAAESYETSSGRTLGVRVFADEDGLLALGDAWRRLEDALPGLTVFQTHRYQSAWARSFALTRRLLILAVYDGEELIGIAPFQVSLVELHRHEFRQLSFLGAPWEVDRPGFLFVREPAACAEAAARALLQRRRQWDFVWFHEQTPADPALDAFCTTLTRAGLLHGRTASSRCPYLRFSGTWQEFLAGKSQKFRKNLKAAKRKLEAAGRLEYESIRGDAARLPALLAEFEALERRSWKAQAGVGITQSVEHLRFARRLAAEFGPRGEFVFRCLRLDGRMIAATFGLVFRRRYYSLHIASDDEFAKHSAGTYLEALELEECFAAGLDEYDFLGGFLSNKLRWATDGRETVAVHLYQKRPLLVAIFIGYFLVKAPLKRWLTRLGITWKERAPENRLKQARRR